MLVSCQSLHSSYLARNIHATSLTVPLFCMRAGHHLERRQVRRVVRKMSSMRQFSLSLSSGRGPLSPRLTVFGVSGRMALCGHSVCLRQAALFRLSIPPTLHACAGEISTFPHHFFLQTLLFSLFSNLPLHSSLRLQ